ncbi:MAG: UDP-N-acetylmuramate dehydrogenase [Chloroflexi bacterium]|nr:UDP-N-acetylmuramate dehydrogenase [Chloroflexota bacterium]
MRKLKLTSEEIKRVIKNTELDNIIFDVETSELTSIKAGGMALCYFIADKMSDLKKMIETCMKNQIEFMVIGDGTNILFSDKYIDLVLLKLGRDFDYLEFSDGNKIIAGAAYKLLKFVVAAAVNGYDFSDLSGIPGTIGGSVMGNSGSKYRGICDFVERVSYISKKGGNIREETIGLSDGDFGYRHFYIQDLIVLTRIVLNTGKSDRNNILEKIASRIKNKKLTQPVNVKSSGCFFKNIPGCSESTGELIEKCGLKGFIYGGARISDKHANFIENFDNSSSEDIFILSKIVKDIVMDKFKIELEYEVRVVGF